MFKRITALIAAGILILSVLTGCAATVDKPCMYCSTRPSRQYKRADGAAVYVCEECSSRCMICSQIGKTRRIDTMLGVAFVCDDCYEIVQSMD